MNKQPDASRLIDVSATALTMKANGNQFAVATVVRTVSVTAAKPGAKAIINADGEIVEGWIGGGCARGAVIKAAVKCISDGEPRLVSIQPEDIVKEQGLTPGKEQDGVLTATNMCPSRGSMEIFVEPVLSDPELLVLGASPVANMLCKLAMPFGFEVVQACDKPPAQPEPLSHTTLLYNEITSHAGVLEVVALPTSSAVAELVPGAISSKL